MTRVDASLLRMTRQFFALPTIHLEQSRRAHSATHAHRDESDSATALAQLVHELRRELRSSSTQRMTERDRTSVHVHLLFWNLEVAHDRHHLSRECLVELDEVDVFHLHPR